MRKRVYTAAATVLFGLVALSGAAVYAQPQAAPSSLYVTSSYDVRRDPAADLRVAVERATRENKRILLEIGGDWCVWCKILDRFLHNNAGVRSAFEASFVIVKVNWSRENENTAFLAQFPQSNGYPDFFVLESDGRFLAQQRTDVLEQGESYDEKKMLVFANRWRKRG